MQSKTKSYLARLAACLLSFVIVTAVTTQAANVYLDPDSTYITTGVGVEFDIALKVDANITGLRLYQVYINYQPDLLDTVSFTLGDLFASSGYQPIFKHAVVQDTITGQYALRVEALLLGPTAVVDGPGTLATIRLRAVGTGVADLSILDYILTDINNDEIPNTTAEGGAALINAPPHEFDMLIPGQGEVVSNLPNDSIQLAWASSYSYYPGESVTYNLEYSTTNAFMTDSTVYLTGLTDTSLYLQVNDLRSGAYYWRIRAKGTLYGWTRYSTTYPGWFQFSTGSTEPSPFSLVAPSEGEVVSEFPGDSVALIWNTSESVNPSAENIFYNLEFSKTTAFEPESTLTVPGLADTSYYVYVNDLRQGMYYWRVTAVGDNYGGSTLSDPFPGSFTFNYAAIEPDPFGLISPADNARMNINTAVSVPFDWEDAVSIIPDDTIKYILYLGTSPTLPGSEIYVDSTYDISTLSIPVTELPLAQQFYWRVYAVNRFDLFRWSNTTQAVLFFYRGDVDNTGSIDIADLVLMVEYMFAGADPPIVEESGDTDCTGGIDISDLVMMVEYMFASGPFPDCI